MMLDAHILVRIREYIEAELGPRSRNLAIAIQVSNSECIKRGVFNSSMCIQGRARVGCQELSVRASLIWQAIRRSHASLVGRPTDGTLEGLQQQISEHVSNHARIISDAASKGGNHRSTWHQIVPQEVSRHRDDLIRRLHLEAMFYMDDLTKRSAAGTGASVLNFHGPVGAVQTGAYATANISMSGIDKEKLKQALLSLRDELQRSSEATEVQKIDASEVISDTVDAIEAERPNGSKIAGLLSGLDSVIQTLASLRPAWEVVRDLAIAAGLLIGGLG